MTTTPDISERIPPQDLEAEQACLGACLLEYDACITAMAMLKEEDFYRQAHRAIYRGICDLINTRQPVDLITLGTWLRDHNQLEEVGGTLYLTTTMSQTPTAAGISWYAEKVKEKATRRLLIHAADRIMADAYLKPDSKAADLVTAAQDAVYNIGAAHEAERGMAHISTFAGDLVKRKRAAVANGYEDGYKTGWPSVNDMIRPMLPTQFVIVAARPKVGKSFFGLNLADSLATCGLPGAIFSLELDGYEMTQRAMQAYMETSGRNLDSLEYCQANPGALDDMEQAADRVYRLPLYIDDRPGLTTTEIMASLRAGNRLAQRQYGMPLCWAVLDYAQLAHSRDRHRTRTEEMGAVAYELKGIAKQFRLLLVSLAQLNQDCEDRSPRRPRPDDLGESGKFLQAADRAFYLYRPGVNGPEEIAAAGLNPEAHGTITEVGLMASRHEPFTNYTYLNFNGDRNAFQSLDTDQWASIARARDNSESRQRNTRRGYDPD
jgi:replicative DNA helicase